MKLIHTTTFRLMALGLLSLLFACQADPAEPSAKEEGAVVQGNELQLQPGFEATLLYSPSENEQGSWVSLAQDPNGDLIASDQYGGLYRIQLPALDDPNGKVQVDSIPVSIGAAQGLLWAYNSLYVVVNASERNAIAGHASGFYRVTDSDGDGELDQVTTLKGFSGEGEHGPHTVVLAPDGNSLYVVGGNHTDLPTEFTSRQPANWQSDRIMPTIKDPRGHASHIKPPGAWVAKTDSLGENWELISVGYRNPYDVAFNGDGELFIFDSDMEWDLGMPWYRPVRVCHVVSGSDYGWRTGSDKWAEYFPDNLPPVANIGQGSPTGVMMGTGAKFPARNQQALYVFDWSFGTMYQINLVPDGSSYQGEVEEFLSGVPLPLTDGIVGADGAMYFATGGRRLGSGLYRVVYTGPEDTSPQAGTNAEFAEARQLRRELEALHGKGKFPITPKLIQAMGHEDRFIRYAARIALQQNPPTIWLKNIGNLGSDWASIETAIAIAQIGAPEYHRLGMEVLEDENWEDLNEEQQLAMLRAYELQLVRFDQPTEIKQTLIAKLDPHFPASSPDVNRRMAELLAAVDAPSMPAKTLALMADEDGGQTHAVTISEALTERSDRYGPAIAKMLKNMPPTQEIAYALALSQAKSGWTPALRQQYFQWFFDALNRSGGVNYKGFIDAIRTMALENVPEEERLAMAELSGQFEAENLLADLPQPKGPGKKYEFREMMVLLGDNKGEARDYEQGRRMYEAATCAACHAIAGHGNAIGPDLTQIGTRFSSRDLMISIMSPSDEVSDQYANTLFTMEDGSVRVGRIVGETEGKVVISPNPYLPNETVELEADLISERKPSPVSPMPAALVNRLNEEELLDLVAYLMSGGDEGHELFSAK
ncbi:MAG: c-type cytochrome [Bacteroidota bacterium]